MCPFSSTDSALFFMYRIALINRLFFGAAMVIKLCPVSSSSVAIFSFLFAFQLDILVVSSSVVGPMTCLYKFI